MVKASTLVVKASETESQTSSEAADGQGEEQYEEYEVEIEQPYGLKFVKGRDGGTYIDAIGAGGSADKTGMFAVGDKVLATRFSLRISPSFFFIFFGSVLFCDSLMFVQEMRRKGPSFPVSYTLDSCLLAVAAIQCIAAICCLAHCKFASARQHKYLYNVTNQKEYQSSAPIGK